MRKARLRPVGVSGFALSTNLKVSTFPSIKKTKQRGSLSGKGMNGVLHTASITLLWNDDGVGKIFRAFYNLIKLNFQSPKIDGART